MRTAILAALLFGCSSTTSTSTGGTVSLTGKWCGKPVATPAECVGDEVEYLVLTQTGTTVTGQHCEAFEKECYDIQSGTLNDTHVTWFYTFSSDRVDVDLTVSGNTMSGALKSTKAPGMSFPLTLTRIP